jgi:hypothetical protein
MHRLLFAAAAALMLTACGRNGGADAPQAGPNGALPLTCDAFASVSAASLASSYGAANVVEQTLPGVEGESYLATIVYPNDPARRLEIVWRDNATKDAPTSVIANTPGSLWTGPHDLGVGDPLDSTERANGQPFQLWGFGWDYGGWVSDWNGGAFATADGCNLRVRFQPRSASNTSAMGDGAFMSNDPAVRAADAVVSEIGLLYTTPQH